MGLSSAFTRGLFAGLAKSSAKGIQDAMDDLDGRLSRLSEKEWLGQLLNKLDTDKTLEKMKKK